MCRDNECLIIPHPAFLMAMALPGPRLQQGERVPDAATSGSGSSSGEAKHLGKGPMASRWDLGEEGD